MSRAKFEERFESVLTDLAVLSAQRNTQSGEADSFCVSYLIPLIDFGNAATQVYIPTIKGYKTELKSVTLYDANSGTVEVFSTAETVDFGPDANADQDLDAATVPRPLNAAGTAAAAGSSRVLLNTNAGSAPTGNFKAIAALTVVTGLGFSFTSAGTTGICDLLVTVRYYL